jgi:murein DD-endopeptidase MepM/ murein hydrolase activator NlpD
MKVSFIRTFPLLIALLTLIALPLHAENDKNTDKSRDADKSEQEESLGTGSGDGEVEEDGQDEFIRLMFDKKEEDYELTQQRRRTLERRLDNYRSTGQRLTGDQKYVTNKLHNTLSQLNEVEEELSALQFEKAELDRSLEDANNELNGLRNIFSQRLRDWYINGMGGYMTLLPTEGDDIDLLVKLYYVENILENDQRLLQEIGKTREYIEEMGRQQDEKIREISLKQLEFQSFEDRYRRQKREIAQRIATNNWRERNAIQELETIEQQSQQIEDFLKSLEAGKIPQIDFSGSFSTPLSKSDYRISSNYGRRYHPIHKQWRLHTGIDLAADRGTPVYASASGVVVKVSYLRSGYGRHLVIYHDKKFSTLYAHCSEILVREGDPVTEGQVVAKVGSTGTSSGNHLHFEIRTNGKTNDPRKFLNF